MKILVADDHALFREGLRYVLRGLEQELEVLEAADGRSALGLAGQHADLDLVLMDVHMPDMDGLEALTLFAQELPTTPVAILSADTAPAVMHQALDRGAMGFIPKDATGAVMIGAVRLILSDGVYVPPALARAPSAANPQVTSGTPARQGSLTPRQHEVLYLLAQGRTNREIGSALGMSESTVKMHLTAIMKTLGVSNRTQAVLAAGRLGLVTRG